MKRLITLARLLIFLLAAFFAVFSLEATLGDTLINLIPTFILTGILLISFPSPRIATFLLFITTVVFTIFFTTYDYYLKFIVITLSLTIAFLIFLFYIILTEDNNKTTDNDNDEDDEEKIITLYSLLKDSTGSSFAALLAGASPARILMPTLTNTPNIAKVPLINTRSTLYKL
jgi:hypothetical protein